MWMRIVADSKTITLLSAVVSIGILFGVYFCLYALIAWDLTTLGLGMLELGLGALSLHVLWRITGDGA